MNTMTKSRARLIPTALAYNYAKSREIKLMKRHIIINRLILLLILSILTAVLVVKTVTMIDCFKAEQLNQIAIEDITGGR